MDQTFWGVVSAAVVTLGPWDVHFETLSPWPGECASPLGATFFLKKKISGWPKFFTYFNYNYFKSPFETF